MYKKKKRDFGLNQKGGINASNVHVQFYTGGVVLEDKSVSLLRSHVFKCSLLHSTHRYIHTPVMQTIIRTVRAERMIMRM